VTSAPQNTLLTSYNYDQVSHLATVVTTSGTVHAVTMTWNSPGGPLMQTRTFVYTPTTYSTLILPALWLTSATNPENGTVSYTYNADGTLASKHDANGNTETYSYDSYQRLTSIPDRQQTFTYDTCPSGATGCTNAPGQLMQATFGSNVGPNDLSFAYNYSYTPAGKVTGKTLMLQAANHSQYGVLASGSLTVGYTYDSQGALLSVTYPTDPAAATYTYTLDAMERPTAMTDNQSFPWASGAYNSLLQLTHVRQATSSGALMDMTYTYSGTNNNGQITQSVDAMTGETIVYQYDALKRLASANGLNWGENYSYDGFGNLTQMSPSGTAGAPTLSVTVDATTNRITPGLQVSYDNNGNMTQSGYLAYDVANRITSAIVQGGTNLLRVRFGQPADLLPEHVECRDDLLVRRGREEAGDIYGEQRNEHCHPVHAAEHECVFRGEAARVEPGPAGVGALWRSERSGLPGAVSVRSGIHADGQRSGEVRDVYAGQFDGAELCGEPVLHQHLGQVLVSGPEYE
jgi:YD repeat-containing protein